MDMIQSTLRAQTMTKTELIEALSNEAGFTRSKAEAVVRVEGLYNLFKFYLMSSGILHYYQ
jgi:hypothetical protein